MSDLPREFSDRIQSIRHKWAVVEDAIKKAELLQHKVVIPAINELRYAARQIIPVLVELLLNKNPINTEALASRLSVTEQYLVNAEHDVTDAVLMFISLIVDDQCRKFGRNSISKQFPQYEGLVDLIRIAKDKVSESRLEPVKRNENYEYVQEHCLPALIDGYKAILDTGILMEIHEETQTALLKQERLRAKIYMYATGIMSLLAGTLVVFEIVR